MEKISSFQVDHTKLPCGMYISRTDDDIVTYDIRTRTPNIEAVMDNASIHTMEHLFATYVRNTPYSKDIIYFGPMGCRTGFYFLTRNIPHKNVIEITKSAFDFIESFEGDIPGASAVECGNYLEHNIDGAKKEAQRMKKVLANWSTTKLNYPN